ncbi:MAG: gamma carbonic anhydrase family protein [Chloroflexota bacterium]|nr:gamma carbonic anhydrase family protein [Chloroflexota bacterium]
MIRGFKGKVPRIDESAFISEAAYVIGDVEIGENSSVWPGAVLKGDFRHQQNDGPLVIGEDTHIEDNAVIHFTRQIGDHVVIGHGAVVEATTVGNNVLIGNNATVLFGSEIGNFCVIAAGALVLEGMKIPDGSFITGVPGKIKGKISAEQIAFMEKGLTLLKQTIRDHKEAESTATGDAL